MADSGETPHGSEHERYGQLKQLKAMRVEDVSKVEEALDAFMRHETKRVFALIGEWGVGKSYLWHDYIRNRLRERNKRSLLICRPYRKESPIKCSRYAYASLFGIGSLENLEQVLVAKSISTSSDAVSFSADNLKNSLDWLKDLKPVKEYGSILTKLVSLLLNDALICLDDLERRGKDLDLAAVLGLVSMLKEERNCKVVIIFNQEKLIADQGAKEVWGRYCEKIVDASLAFDPKVESNLAVAIKNEGIRTHLLPVFLKLNVNNLRVMNLCNWLVEEFQSSLLRIPKEAHAKILLHIGVYCCVRYAQVLGPEHDVSWVLELNPYSFMGDDEVTEAATKAANIMATISFCPNDYDKSIVDCLLIGTYDQENFVYLVNRDCEQQKWSETEDAYVATWKEFYGSRFTVATAQVSDAMVDFLHSHFKTLRMKYMHNTVDFILRIDDGRHSEMTELYSSYVHYHLASLEDEQFDEIRKDWLDAKTIVFVDEALASVGGSESIEETMERVLSGDSLSRRDAELLKTYSREDIKSWLSTSERPRIITDLQKFLPLLGSLPDEGVEDTFKGKFSLALVDLARESLVNRYRVSNLFPAAINIARKLGEDVSDLSDEDKLSE